MIAISAVREKKRLPMSLSAEWYRRQKRTQLAIERLMREGPPFSLAATKAYEFVLRLTRLVFRAKLGMAKSVTLTAGSHHTR